mgnify:CR=1 FL=1
MAAKISAENFETEVLKSTVPVLVDFYTDSCVPCKRMAPMLAELEEEYGGRFKLCKVNVSANLPLSEKYGVLSAPTLVFFSGGTEHMRKTGFTGKEATREIINQILEE